jgi:hypothetical protein
VSGGCARGHGVGERGHFDALRPFFRIVEQGLDGLVRPGRFFDLLTEDITVFDALGWPPH